MKKKKQTYSKIIPALALLGGAYLLLSKSSTPTPNNTGGTTGGGGVAPIDTGNTSTGLSAFNAVPVNANITTFQSATSGSQVAGTDIGRLQMPSQVVSNYMTQAGLAEPQSRGERMIEAGAGGISSALSVQGIERTSPFTLVNSTIHSFSRSRVRNASGVIVVMLLV
jgi:hypothetical protein